MNPGIKDPAHPSILYYDGDYPSKEYSAYPENFDGIVIGQGIADDVDRYLLLTRQYGKQVLELCCGTGRVAIPLVLDGCTVTAVDISGAQLDQFRAKINTIPGLTPTNPSLVEQDVTRLTLPKKDFDVVICAFNSLLCIPDRQLQQDVLDRAASHIRTGGLLALDIWNPLVLNLWGDRNPTPFFTRKNPRNGNTYTRFSAIGPMNMDQVQSLYGWYDETRSDGSVKRTTYEMQWRLIFRYEIELMLEKAGFRINAIAGGNEGEPLELESPKMFIEAIKVG